MGRRRFVCCAQALWQGMDVCEGGRREEKTVMRRRNGVEDGNER
jgi:hypothetical protein